MTAQNPSEPLGPLSAALTNALTAKVGPPESHFITITGGKDIHTIGWTIGRGKLVAAPGGDEQRGTDVEIIVLESGSIVTARRSWTRGLNGNSVSGSGRVNSDRQAAYEWLLADGDGRLGRASKEAWVQACRNFPPMSDLEYEMVK